MTARIACSATRPYLYVVFFARNLTRDSILFVIYCHSIFICILLLLWLLFLFSIHSTPPPHTLYGRTVRGDTYVFIRARACCILQATAYYCSYIRSHVYDIIYLWVLSKIYMCTHKYSVYVCMCARSNRGSIITDNSETKIIHTLTFKLRCSRFGCGLSVKCIT